LIELDDLEGLPKHRDVERREVGLLVLRLGRFDDGSGGLQLRGRDLDDLLQREEREGELAVDELLHVLLVAGHLVARARVDRVHRHRLRQCPELLQPAVHAHQRDADHEH